jgi:hypothetical protein
MAGGGGEGWVGGGGTGYFHLANHPASLFHQWLLTFCAENTTAIIPTVRQSAGGLSAVLVFFDHAHVQSLCYAPRPASAAFKSLCFHRWANLGRHSVSASSVFLTLKSIEKGTYSIATYGGKEMRISSRMEVICFKIGLLREIVILQVVRVIAEDVQRL